MISTENAKVTNKGRSTVFRCKPTKMVYDKSVVIKKMPEDDKCGKELPLLEIAEIPHLQ